MMKKRLKLTLLFVLMVSATTFAQKLKVQEGKLKNLEAITEYNMVFDYTDVQIPKYKNEEEFLEDKMKKRDEDEPGSGEKFRESWFIDREERYKPKFIESFNKRFDDGEIKATEKPDAKYTMKIHTTKLYPGYNVGVWRHNAEIDATITVYETANPSNIVFSGSYKDVQGNGAMGYDFDSGYRISECYAKLAKEFAKKIR